MLAQSRGLPVGGFALALPKLPRVAAFRIIRAADEGSESPELQTQSPGATGRANTRIRIIRRGREHVRTEDLVKLGDHLRDPKVLCSVNGSGKVFPEIAQKLLPGKRTVGNFVEPFFKIGSE